MELLERFVAGDLEAFEALFRQHQSEVYRWTVRIVRDTGAAEDLTVETFWRIYRARERFATLPPEVSAPGPAGSPPTPLWTTSATRARKRNFLRITRPLRGEIPLWAARSGGNSGGRFWSFPQNTGSWPPWR